MRWVARGLHGRHGGQLVGASLGTRACRLGFDARIVYRLGATGGAVPRRGVFGKNDANDAAGVCEAAGRPHMRFVPVKSIEQHSMLAVHRLREGVRADRTACFSRIRGLLLEFGSRSLSGARDRAGARRRDDVLENACDETNHLARVALQRAQAQWRELDAHPAWWCDERVAAHAKGHDHVKRAGDLMGIGPVGASAAIATVGDFKQFDSGAQFGAWLGLVPRLHLSGGQAHLGSITNRGDPYLRTLLIQGAWDVR